MSSNQKNVDKFLAAVRRRNNRRQLWSVLIGAATAAAALLIAVGLWYIVRGYAVPRVWIAGVCSAALSAAAVVWALRRSNVERAAHFADRFFRLQDSVTSFLHFSAQGRREGFYSLQARQTAERVAGLDAGEIRCRPPRRLVFLAVGLAVVALPVCLAPPSDEVLQREQMERETLQETAAINQELIDEAEKLIEETAGKDEEKLIDPDKLRRWVEELKATGDRAEALRQYARLERNLQQARLAMKRLKDEQLLDRIAKELGKKEETRPLGKLLEQKKYDRAADKFQEMKPEKSKPLDDRRREMAKLKALSKQMSAAANRPGPPRKSDNPSSDGKPSDASNPDDMPDGGEELLDAGIGELDGQDAPQLLDAGLGGIIDKLDDALEGWDDGGDDWEEIELLLGDILDEFGDELRELYLLRRADDRLAKLLRRCGRCQSKLAVPRIAPNAGGHKAGWGSNNSRREGRDELKDNGQNTQLKGSKGSGPSLSKIESADGGSGASNRQATAKKRDFKRQFESFVQREDVPESLRNGVKRYFQIIHDNHESAPPEENPQE